jgi:hypothetical protein
MTDNLKHFVPQESESPIGACGKFTRHAYCDWEKVDCPDCLKTQTRTPNEITELKSSWCTDPSWDIETTEGFAAHREELKIYRLEMEAKWEKEDKGDLQTYATTMGIPNNLTLAAHLRWMAERIEELETILQLNGLSK